MATVVDLTQQGNSDYDSLTDISHAGTSPLSKKRSLSPSAEASQSATKKQKLPQQRTLASLFGASGSTTKEKPKKIKKQSADAAKVNDKPKEENGKGKGKGSAPKQEPNGESVQGVTGTLCHHHHRSTCQGPLLECTFMKGGKQRCHARYCYKVLKSAYNQDPNTIVKTGRMMVDESLHCPVSEAKYAWKCPRCRNLCQCSECRKKNGLPLLGKQASVPQNGSSKGTPEAKPKKANSSNTSAPTSSNGKGKGKFKEEVVSTPPPPKKMTNTLNLPVKPRTPQLRTLKAPVHVEPPAVEVITTLLPHENLRARMWLYESFVRLDKLGLSKNLLSTLDKFDEWSPSRVQEMLAILLKFLGGLSNIEKGQPSKNTTRPVLAFRTHGSDLTRGEPWIAAREMLERLGFTIQQLQYVEHPVELLFQEEAASASPPLTRETRSRRAKDEKRVNYTMQLSLLEDWDEDFEEKKPSRRRKRRIVESDDEDMEEGDDDAMDEDDGMAEANDEPIRGGLTRRQAAAAAAAATTKDPEPSPQTSRRPTPEPEQPPQDAPDLETKISILASLVDVTLSYESIAEELRHAPEEITALEKKVKADTIALEKEAAEQMAELNKRAPSLVSPNFAAWKAEKAELEADLKWRRLDLRVFHEIAVDAHALRTGPLGTDVDGREYWHLREYQDRMPRYTEGRYSWCLLVLGPRFPPVTKKEEKETRENSFSPPSLYVEIPPSDTSPPSSSDTVLGTNDPAAILTTIEFIKFRLAQKEYDEASSDQRGLIEMQGKDGESDYALRKFRKQMRENEATRQQTRERVETLCNKLERSREYFAWHREEAL